MFHAYHLTQKGAPVDRVWFARCDTPGCSAFLGPLVGRIDQRAVIESAGWTYGAVAYEDRCPAHTDEKEARG